MSIKRFVTIDVLRTALSMNVFYATNHLIFSSTIFGFEFLDKIYLHPDGVLKIIKRRGKRQLEYYLKNSHTLSAPPDHS